MGKHLHSSHQASFTGTLSLCLFLFPFGSLIKMRIRRHIGIVERRSLRIASIRVQKPYLPFLYPAVLVMHQSTGVGGGNDYQLQPGAHS